MEQVVIIVVIGLISLVNWLMKRSAEIREERKQERQRLGIPEGDPFHPTARTPASSPPPVIDHPPEIRRLMEALGLPVDAGEPPVVHETVPIHPPLPTFRRSAPTKPRIKKSPAFSPPHAEPASPLLFALRSHDGIRQAVILREILGPPKAL